MNTIKKIGLTALGTTLIATSASAGALSVSGTAGVTLNNVDNRDKGNSFSMSDSLNFSGSGELDNGWNVTLNMEVDGNTMDDRSVVINMGDMGTLTFSGSGGSSAMSAVDDVMPTAYGESWDVIGSTTETTAGGASKVAVTGGYATANSFFYSAPEMVEGLGVNLSYVPSGTSRPDGTVSVALAYTGIDGLTIGYAQDDNGLTGTSKIENNTAYIKYAYGPVTVGVQESEADQSSGTSGDDESSIMGITYQVSDDLTIGYTKSEVDLGDKALDQESENLSISYTTGGVTIAAALVEMNNVGGSANAQDDLDGFEIDVSFAF